MRAVRDQEKLPSCTSLPAAAHRRPSPPQADMGTDGAVATAPEHPPHEGHWDNVGECRPCYPCLH